MDRSQKEVKMSAISQEEWENDLTEILALLNDKEYNKLFDFIPEIEKPKKKTKNFKSELPKTIIKHYGVNESIQKIKDAMDQIPRKDDEVQNLLRPFVAKLEKTDEPRSSQPQQDRESHLLDSHAVLRELTASMDEMKGEIRTLKQENQEQRAKLETEIEQLKQQLKALSVQEKKTSRR